MPTGIQKRCKNIGDPYVSAFLGLWAVGKMKNILWLTEILQNLAQTIGFHHPPFLSKLGVRTILRRGTLNLRWEHAKIFEFLRFLAAPAGWDPLQLAERLADSPESCCSRKRWKSIRIP